MWSLQLLANFLFPSHCVGCRQHRNYLCRYCLEQVEFLALPQQDVSHLLALDAVFCLASFAPPFSTLIKTFKYQGVTHLVEFLAELLYNALWLPPFDCVTAVPMHPRKQAQRGFNQAELLAQKIAHLYNKPYLPLLKKQVATLAQAKNSSKNIRALAQHGLFAPETWVRYPESQLLVQTQTVLIVDDVFTTGATLNNCAQVLQAIGFNKVIGCTLARSGGR